jgi:hypothetical protein
MFADGLLMEVGNLRILACENASTKIEDKQTIATARFIQNILVVKVNDIFKSD